MSSNLTGKLEQFCNREIMADPLATNRKIVMASIHASVLGCRNPVSRDVMRKHLGFLLWPKTLQGESML